MRALLAIVWRDRGKPSPAIDPALVKDVERALACTIPHEVLAILAAEGRTLDALPALTGEIDAFYGATIGQSWKKDLRFEHVAFARLPSDDSEPVYACFRKKTKALASWDLREPSPDGTAIDVASYVRTQFASDASVHLDTPATPEDVAAFVPRLEAPPPPPKPKPRRVAHATFGEGTVLEAREGKLRIAFDAHGEKLLAEKFVRFLD